MIKKGKVSFDLSGKELEPLLKRSINVLATGIGAPLFALFGSKKKIYLLASNDDALLMVKIPGTSDGEGSVSFDGAALAGLVKNRADLSVKYDGRNILVAAKTGKYSSSIQAHDLSESMIETIERRMNAAEGGFELGAEFVSKLKDLVAKTRVTDPYTKMLILTHIFVQDNLLHVSSYAGNTFAQITSKVDAPDFKIALPAYHFALIEQLAMGESLKFSLGHGSLHAEGEGVTLILPFTQTTDDQFARLPSFIDGLGSPKYACVVDLADMESMCGNLKTITSVNAAYDITPGKKELDFEFKTANGKAKDSLAVLDPKGKSDPISVIPELFSDALAAAKRCGAVTFQIYEKIIVFRAKSTVIGCARKH